MPSSSEFVGRPLVTSVVVAPDPVSGLDGGTIQQSFVELQEEINENSEAADTAVAIFENSLL